MLSYHLDILFYIYFKRSFRFYTYIFKMPPTYVCVYASVQNKLDNVFVKFNIQSGNYE